MKKDLPQVDIPQNFVAWTNVPDNILVPYKQTCKLRAAIFVLCLKGSMKISINLIDYNINANDVIVLFPDNIIHVYEQKRNVKFSVVAFSSKSISTLNLFDATIDQLPMINENPKFSLDRKVAPTLKNYISFLSDVYTQYKETLPLELIKNILSTLLCGIGILYKGNKWIKKELNRSEEICKQLMKLVVKYYTTQRHVSFYAEQLGISFQHLSITVKQKTGKNVSDIISEMVMMDAKAKLRSTNMTIQEIAYSLNFPSVSFFGKYFKRRQGVSPKKYRKN